MSAKTAIRDWTAIQVRSQSRWAGAGVIACLLGGFLAFYITYWIFVMFLFVTLGGWLRTDRSLMMASCLLLAVLFVVYLLIDLRPLEKYEFDSPSRLKGARLAGRLIGDGFGSLAAGSKTAFSFAKVLFVCLFAGPGLLALSGRLCLRLLALQRVNPDAVSRALLHLLREERKIPCTQLESKAPIPLPELLQQLQLFDGVVIRGKKTSEIYLTESIRQDLVAAVTARAGA